VRALCHQNLSGRLVERMDACGSSAHDSQSRARKERPCVHRGEHSYRIVTKEQGPAWIPENACSEQGHGQSPQNGQACQLLLVSLCTPHLLLLRRGATLLAVGARPEPGRRIADLPRLARPNTHDTRVDSCRHDPRTACQFSNRTMQWHPRSTPSSKS